MILESALLSQVPGLLHGFGSQDEPVPKFLWSAWSTARPLGRQVHGSDVARVKYPLQACGSVDAYITQVSNLPIGVATADCVPILMTHRSGAAIAAVHAGWKGTRARILQRVFQSVRESFGPHLRNPIDWVAAVGPAIGPCCYQVSEELALDFAKEFKPMGIENILPAHRMLDLQAINARELHQMGFSEVEVIRVCTRCSKAPILNSYRRFHESPETSSLDRGRQWSIVMRAE